MFIRLKCEIQNCGNNIFRQKLCFEHWFSITNIEKTLKQKQDKQTKQGEQK